MSTLNATLGGQAVEIDISETALVWPASGLLGLDVETTWLTDRGQWDPEFKIRTVQFATKRVAWVYDLSVPEEREHVVKILADPAYTFCSHTDMDVMSTWVEFGIDIAPRNVDTRMLAIEARPDMDWGNDLKALATAYGMPELEEAEKDLHALFLDMWVAQGGKRNAKKADIQKYGWEHVDLTDERFLIYAALDAIACRRLAEILTPQTRNPPELIKVDQWLHVQAAHLRMAGKRVDYERMTKLLAEARQVTGEAKSKAMDLTGGVNIDGPKIKEWLAEHGAHWVDWTGARSKTTGEPSLAKENLRLLLTDFELDDVGREVVGLMSDYKSKLDMLRKTEDINRRVVWEISEVRTERGFTKWGEKVPRIHPLLNPIGASTTARMSASGPNMQNFSKTDPTLRGLFLPEDGHTLMTIDFDQIELRVVAALAREQKMIDVILAGGDLHQLTVDLLRDEYGIEIVRDTAKMSNFLIVYGGGGQALHDQGGIPLEMAYEIVRAQRRAYPSISNLTNLLAMEKDAIRTVSCRRLPVTRNKKTGDIRSYANVNYAVQSAARELLVDGWRRLEQRWPGVVWWPIHDELVLQVPDGDVDAVAADAQWAMTFDFRNVPITATPVVLRDENGVSRWMTSKNAEKIQKELLAA